MAVAQVHQREIVEVPFRQLYQLPFGLDQSCSEFIKFTLTDGDFTSNMTDLVKFFVILCRKT